MAEHSFTGLGSAPPAAPTFIRLLARLTDLDVPKSDPMLTEQLSQWLDWARAVALSRALDGGLPATEDAPVVAEDDDPVAECARVRASLLQAIGNEPLLAPARQGAEGTGAEATGPEAADAVTAPAFDVFRQRCLALQRNMLAATGRLRGLLRERLATRSPDLARLAEVDAVMEQVLSGREQRWLSVVPDFLGQHYERLRAAASQAGAAADACAWVDLFRQDMRQVLLAELEFRFQPLDALLAAQRA